MSFYSGNEPASRVGAKMIRISIPFFYSLGAAMHGLSVVKAGAKLNDCWYAALSSANNLRGLFAAGWFNPAVKSSYQSGQKLLTALEALSARNDFDVELTHMDAWAISNPLQEFETVLKNELNIADAYFVTSKGAYETGALIGFAERIFPLELAAKVPQSIVDIREGGKCLAFELNTAAGFHVLRATESVLRVYWDAASKGKPHPKQKNIGVYLQKMDKGNIGSSKVRAVLHQIKDLHRNPLMHPEETLTIEEAISLFGICQSAISAMLKDIPDPKAAKAVLPATIP